MSTCTASSRDLALPQRRQQGERTVHAADRVGEGDAHAQRLLADVAGGVGEPGVGLEHRTPRRVRRHRPGLAVAGHRHRRDAGVELGQPLGRHAERTGAPGRHVVHEEIGVGDQRVEHRLALDRLGVDAQAALGAVHLVPRAHAVPAPLARLGLREDLGADRRRGELAPTPRRVVDRAGARPEAAAERVFDLDDVDAEVAERAGGQRAGPRDADLQHASGAEVDLGQRPVVGLGQRGDEGIGVGTERRRRGHRLRSRRCGTGGRAPAPSGPGRAAARASQRATICSDSSTCV